MNIDCSGQGSPTVILESGSGCPSIDWLMVQPEVAKFARVCSYDRAGYGWSDSGSEPRSSLQREPIGVNPLRRRKTNMASRPAFNKEFLPTLHVGCAQLSTASRCGSLTLRHRGEHIRYRKSVPAVSSPVEFDAISQT